MKYVLTSFLILILGLTGILNPLKNVTNYVFVPIQFGLRRIAYDLRQSITFYTHVADIRNENIDLISQKIKLEQDIIDLKSFKSENDLLRKQLGLKNERSDLQLILEANAMGNPSDPSNSTIFIDKGEHDGIKPKDSVVIGPHLIGTVRSVSYGSSVVELISSSGMIFSVLDIDSPDKTEGLAMGKHGSNVTLEKILPSERINIDDTIVTTGKEGLFPRNLIIGKVTEVSNDPSQPLKIAQVRSGIDLSKLGKVFVIRSN